MGSEPRDDGPPDTVHGFLLGSESLGSVLHRAAGFARRSLVGVDEASITLTGPGRRPATAAWTGLAAFELDECQYGLGYGPCLHAADSGEPVRIGDTGSETRWSAFAQLAAQRGVLGVLALPIPLPGPARAALNLYSVGSGAPGDPPSIAAARLVADQVSTVLSNKVDLDAARAEAANLLLAMESRATIEQAKGILMTLHGYSAEDAFADLSDRSQRTNTKIRDIAARYIGEVRRT